MGHHPAAADQPDDMRRLLGYLVQTAATMLDISDLSMRSYASFGPRSETT